MYDILWVVSVVFFYLLVLTFIVSNLSKKNDSILQTPALDWVVALYTLIPWSISHYYYRCTGLIGTMIGQILMLSAFCTFHPFLMNYKGTTMKNTLNEIVGPFRNHLGLYISLLAFPVLWTVRISQIIIYPLLVWTLNFPKYKSGDWINLSRQKYNGLISHDLIWCLYCEWMTGIYSFAGEMLRNVESFWCPIKFYDGKKCENCKIDFPDIEQWISSTNNTVEEVDKLIKEKYPVTSNKPRSWYGHPDRKK